MERFCGRPNVWYEPNPEPTPLPPRHFDRQLYREVTRAALAGVSVAALVFGTAGVAVYATKGEMTGTGKVSNRTSLSQELKEAYTKVDITRARNTGRVVLGMSGDRLQLVDFSVAGTRNPATDRPGAPGYFAMPLTSKLVVPRGVSGPADVHMDQLQTSGAGQAEEAVDLRPFGGRQAVTEDVNVYANNRGTTGGTEYDASYYAGTLRLQGQGGHLTSVTITHEDVPKVSVTEHPTHRETPHVEP